MKSSEYRSIICHGEDEKCFTVFGRKMPICSRCLGVYLGMIFGVILGFFMDLENHGGLLFILTVVVLIPFTLDGLLQELNVLESTNTRRLTTGFLVGFMLGMDLVWICGRI